MDAPRKPGIEAAMAGLPTGRYVMTSVHEGQREGILVRSVSVCSDEPPLISVAARKGHPIDPVVRDARVFAVCALDAGDRLTERAFSDDALVMGAEPFETLGSTTLMTGAPVLTRARIAFDCELVRRIDLEADHELFIGQVVASWAVDAERATG